MCKFFKVFNYICWLWLFLLYYLVGFTKIFEIFAFLDKLFVIMISNLFHEKSKFPKFNHSINIYVQSCTSKTDYVFHNQNLYLSLVLKINVKLLFRLIDIMKIILRFWLFNQFFLYPVKKKFNSKIDPMILGKQLLVYIFLWQLLSVNFLWIFLTIGSYSAWNFSSQIIFWIVFFPYIERLCKVKWQRKIQKRKNISNGK